MINSEASIQDTKYDFAGKKVLVMGLGRFGGGVDAAIFAAEAGAKVIITDLAPPEQLSDSINQLEQFTDIEYHLSSHDPADFKQADIIIVNPAVPPDSEFLQYARKADKFITSQINIFFYLCPATIIGITGANGKSTTAALAAHLLKNTQYANVWLSGNIGNQALLATIEQIKTDDLVVLELSSFQLEQLAQDQYAPKVALLTNLTPNHLDRHGSFEDYCSVKENIFKFQKPDKNSPSVSIFNAEDKISSEWFEKYNNQQGRHCLKFSTDDVGDDIRSYFPLPGQANLSNLAAAMAIAKHFGITDDQIKTCLPDFKPLPHRLELIAQINGVSWYNDSNATTPQSTIAALQAFDEPKIIIAGGYDKNLSFEKLGKEIAKRTKAAILIGQTAKKIADAIAACPDGNAEVKFAESLAQAVDLANQQAENGDVVLLSPACASYDMFDNFQHRGQEFVKLVREVSV
ncbi:MAG: UDP-N-acetylmuramoyl-L-alanine--D-glutamate ligase [Planctomycetota bacterium]